MPVAAGARCAVNGSLTERSIEVWIGVVGPWPSGGRAGGAGVRVASAAPMQAASPASSSPTDVVARMIDLVFTCGR